jgi:hypothetical protein
LRGCWKWSSNSGGYILLTNKSCQPELWHSRPRLCLAFSGDTGEGALCHGKVQITALPRIFRVDSSGKPAYISLQLCKGNLISPERQMLFAHAIVR